MWPVLVWNMISEKSGCFFTVLFLFLSACQPELEGPKYTSGNADFSRYVAIGSDFTAGYLDLALTREGQLQSYPALIASRFSLAGGTDFRQPLVHPGNGYGFNFISNVAGGKLRLKNYTNCLLESDIITEQLPLNTADVSWIGDLGPYNNLGVPGAKSFNLNSQIFGKGGSTGNPFFYRIASDTGGTGGLSSTILGDASLVNPSFFTLWIGLNDVLWFALAGGEANGNTALKITDVPVFEASIDTIVGRLVSGGAGGVVAGIPDITDFPYFTTIPYNGLLLDSIQAAALNASSPPGIQFKAGSNAFVVSNPGGGNIRQLKNGELLLSAISPDSLRCYGKGTPQNPISSKYVLDTAEVSAIRQAILSYNIKLKNTAATRNLAYADMYQLFRNFTSGSTQNGVLFSNQYLRNSVFSTDGIYPNSRGYAIIANTFIQTINTKYGSNLPPVDVNASTGIIFP